MYEAKARRVKKIAGHVGIVFGAAKLALPVVVLGTLWLPSLLFVEPEERNKMAKEAKVIGKVLKEWWNEP